MIASTLDNNTAIASGKICQECGLCCTGALFTHVYINGNEAKKIRKCGVPVQNLPDDKFAFNLPCSGYKDGCCSLYESRPTKCSNYSCKLMNSVINGDTPYKAASKTVSKTKKEMEWLLTNQTAKSKDQKDIPNLRNYLKSYLKLATKLNNKSLLSDEDKTYILKAFDYLKQIDRFFATSYLVTRYASLINAFKPYKKLRTVQIKGHKITVIPKKKVN